MKVLIALVLTSLLAVTAMAHEGHDHGNNPPQSPRAGDKTALICNTDKSICTQLQFLVDINSSAEGAFFATIKTPDNKAINNLKVDLWMSMGNHGGHGSAPVEIAETGHNQVKVSNAWFVMPGTWSVRLEFDLEGIHQHFEVPVYVAE
ncbi:hypothetical protein [Bdellovibrio svalbardensis]|uniref:FixH family protein n=1 Tax=Bdellovibrio svalbardensis TaxID=2972972 RepID=A0ABT6DNK7_9BACT|nr:hypothetical protein [Bdellovibrio svalbardensis]MDG0817519.1 FixH family protein [Bdellovibrio svalbardensis]